MTNRHQVEIPGQGVLCSPCVLFGAIQRFWPITVETGEHGDTRAFVPREAVVRRVTDEGGSAARGVQRR